MALLQMLGSLCDHKLWVLLPSRRPSFGSLGEELLMPKFRSSDVSLHCQEGLFLTAPIFF